MAKNETQRFGKTKRNSVIFSVLAIIIIVSNILVYIGLSNQINSLQSSFFTIQTIYGTLEQRPYPRFWEDPPSVMVYVVSPTPNCVNPYYLSDGGNVLAQIDWLEMANINVGDKVEVDGLVWYRSDRWGNKTYKMLEWFSMRKR
jgi:hypothetical protein